MSGPQPLPRRIVAAVALLNFAYFWVELAVAQAIGSVSLFADSIDFLEDTAVNMLVLLALGWSLRRRATVGMLLALVLLAPGLATLWAAWQQVRAPAPPDPALLSVTGLGALGVNLLCAAWLAKVRTRGGSLTRAAFLSARNDAIANLAIIGAGALTAATRSHWPDLVVGLLIFAINLGAAHEVYEAARAERRDGGSRPADA